MDTNNSADTSWIVATSIVTVLFFLAVIAIYLWKQGYCLRARWSRHKPHIHSRASLNEIEDPSVMVCLLPNGITIHSVQYEYTSKKREAVLKMSKQIPDEYKQNVITKAIAYVSKRQGVPEESLSGSFGTEDDTLLISIIKTTDDNKENKSHEGIELEQEKTETWWG